MAVFRVPDGAGRTLCLLTAYNLGAAQVLAERFLPASSWADMSGSGLTSPEQAAELQLSRMAPMTLPPFLEGGSQLAPSGTLVHA